MVAAKNARHIMVDTETLSLARNAAVIDIAAVVVGTQNAGSEMEYFHKYINPDEYMLVPATGSKFHIDKNTVAWHKSGESPSLKQAELEGVAVAVATKEFYFWLKAQQERGPLYVWCDGSDFDIPVLTNLFNFSGVSIPWSYRCVRDLRTLVNVLATDKPAGADHSALGDAKCQAQWLEDCLAKHGVALA